ncbi:MAG: YncE family protein [Deltaproteobacteria bacterium]|nr:YncE family protein [Deltaproteobacteria bacterium]
MNRIVSICLLITLVSASLTEKARGQLLVATDPVGDQLTFMDVTAGSVAGFASGGAGPMDAAVSADGTLVVAAESSSGQLLMVDLANGTRQQIPIGGSPTAVALDPAGTRAFVSDATQGSLTTVDLASSTVVSTVTAGTLPTALAADSARAYTANFADDTLTLIDGATGAIEATVAVGGFPSGVVADRTGSRVWVANFFDDTVSVVDPATATVIATVPVGPAPRALAHDAVQGRVYVGSFTDGTVTVLDATNHGVIGTAASGGINPINLVVSPTGDRLFILHLASPDLVTLDTSTLNIASTWSLPAGHVSLAGYATALPAVESIVEVPTLQGMGLVILVVLLMAAASSRLRQRARQRNGSPSFGAALFLLLLASFIASSVASSVGAAAPTPLGPIVQIDDGEFLEGDWEIFEEIVGTGSQAAGRSASGGNPDAFRTMNHFGEAVEVVHRYIGAGGTYSPAVTGEIQSLSFHRDRILLSLDGGNAEFLEALVVIQDNQRFTGPLNLFQPTAFGVWEGASDNGLTAQDFDDGAGGTPDFTAAGSDISFGYMRRSGSPGTTPFLTHGIDNFQVTLTAGGGGGGTSILGFVEAVQGVVDGDPADLIIERSGEGTGAVGVTVLIPLQDGSVVTEKVCWGPGDTADKVVTTPSSGLLPITGGMGAVPILLVNATGDAQVHPVRNKTLLMVSPTAGPVSALFLFLLLLASSADPWLWLPLAALALYLLGRRAPGGTEHQSSTN